MTTAPQEDRCKPALIRLLSEFLPCEKPPRGSSNSQHTDNLAVRDEYGPKDVGLAAKKELSQVALKFLVFRGESATLWVLSERLQGFLEASEPAPSGLRGVFGCPEVGLFKVALRRRLETHLIFRGYG